MADGASRVTYDVRIDSYSPPEMAGRVLDSGVAKSKLDFVSTGTLAVLAGAFIALGAELATLVGTDTQMGYGPTRLMMGVAFSLGLILVVVAGAELFTGNTLIVMAWASGRVRTARLLRNWGIVYLGNLVGSLGTALLVYWGRVWTFDGGKVGVTALTIANTKSSLSPEQALALGILCNSLVCIAVWLCFSARSTTDKILSIIFPITAFVASGFEHSIANMYFIPMGILLKGEPSVVQAAAAGGLTDLHNLTWGGFLLNNLLPVTVGNIVGGAVLVGGIYWIVYLRAAHGDQRRLARVQDVIADALRGDGHE